MSDDSNSIIQHPEIKLEFVRYEEPGNVCDGRGGKTAAARGYNAERLAQAVLDNIRFFHTSSIGSWHDTFIEPSDDSLIWVETKCCINRYSSGQYGRFRIWKRNHDRLIESVENLSHNSHTRDKIAIYFFVVYRLEYGVEREVGKLAVPAEMVDSVLDTWSLKDHVTMGKTKVRDISWSHLLKQLGVSPDQFESADAIDLTSDHPIL